MKELAQMSQVELIEKVRSLESEVGSIRLELAETNQGVVALYGELDERARQLTEAIEIKGRFLSYMSHEFRTPLSSILSIARLLADCMDGPLTEEQQRQVEFIRSSASEMSEIVNDLLDMAKMEAGRLTVSPEWFEMVDLFGALRGMFKPLVVNKNVSLIFEATDIPPIYTDHGKLMQILRNFISNALKFTDEGEIRVSARYEPTEMVHFTVTDTGIGIPQEYLGAIFDDFVQVNSSIQRRYRGTGLGLALCKSLSDLLGGQIGVESEMHKGSMFYVLVPIRIPGEKLTS